MNRKYMYRGIIASSGTVLDTAFVLLIAFALLFTTACQPAEETRFDAEPEVRVLLINTLDEFALTAPGPVTITDQSTGAAIDSDTGIADPDIRDEVREDAHAAPTPLVFRLDGDAVTVTRGGKELIAGRWLTVATDTEFTIADVPYGINWWWGGTEDRIYEGELHVHVNGDGDLEAVLHLPMEEYLKGVIPYEIGPDSPLQALMAQAVAARAEIVQTLLTGKYQGEHHDVCAEVECQVFAGNHRRTARSDSAVTLTRGEVLMYGAEVIDAYYASNCGGMSERVEKVWPWRGGPKPYLVALPDTDRREYYRDTNMRETGGRETGSGETERVTENREPGHSDQPGERGHAHAYESGRASAGGMELIDPQADIVAWLDNPPESWCNPYIHTQLPEWSKANFRWERRVANDEFEPEFRGLDSLEIVERGESGRLHRIRAWRYGQAQELDYELAIRQMIHPPLRSSAFTWSREDNDWLFRGAGWGHGVGMCQSGAISQAWQGYGYDRILRHYFPGTRLERLYD